MNNPNLFTRSSYTFFNSLLKIDDIINLSLSNGFNNAFLVDRNIMYGTMEFYSKCLKHNIKPIVGLEIDYNDINEIYIAKNTDGYKELMRISSVIKTEEILIIDETNLLKIDLKLNPVLYKNPNDIDTLKDFYSISNSDEFNKASTHFLTIEEFKHVYGNDILDSVNKIINVVEIEIKERKNILPSFKIDGKKVDSKEYLKEKLRNNLMKVLNKNKILNRKIYIDRVSYELEVISKMGFESYFLIVSDIVNWSKENGIFVGPGRGSAPGSLISYLLNITTIDPIENNLLFERFLNPERVTMPDIDIDFEDARRDEVIEYISQKYGKTKVAQIITYQTLRARMSFKDMARIKGLSATETNEITKLIPEDLILKDAYKKTKKFAAKIDSSQMLKDIFESAKLIEGLPRQFSTHAAGIVISDKDIFKSVPVQKGYGDILQTQYSMDYMEYNGLLKIDILGLRNLSFLREILNSILVNKNKIIKLKEINFEDSKVYERLSQGKTSGVFQLESPGMKSSLKEIGVTKFEDVVATTALFRPGPMKMIPEFAARKKGIHEIKYINEDIKEILESTYGVIVYQEQIMQIVQIFSNFTLSKADILRRAIGKKDINLLESLKEEFYLGAKQNGHEDKTIDDTYNLIYEFSNYGFNRSHAFSYTVISYWLAWLKINYPLEFMNSLLNSVIGNSSKTSEYVSECDDMGIRILEPSIFNSDGEFKIDRKNIYIGLRAIKRVGESIVKTVNSMREKINKKMKFIDFMIICDEYNLSHGSIEILIKAGALRDFGLNKETLLSSLKNINDYLKMIKVKDGDSFYYNKNLIPDLKIKMEEENNEKEYFVEVMGFALSGKEANENINNLIKKVDIKIDELTNLEQDQSVIFAGEIISVREITTKTNKKMAFASINNGTRKVSVTYWPATFDKFSSLLKPTVKAVFYAKVDLKRGENLIINKMEEIN